MVQLHVKRGDDSQFLLSTTVDAPVEAIIQQIAAIYSGRLKVDRICSGETSPFFVCVLFLKMHMYSFLDHLIIVKLSLNLHLL